MASLNRIQLLGNLTRDPDVRETASGLKYAKITIATSRTFKDKDGNKKEESQFHNCTAWKFQADLIEQYVKKGSKIYVEGMLKHSSTEKDGKTTYYTDIAIENIILISSTNYTPWKDISLSEAERKSLSVQSNDDIIDDIF